MNRVLLVGNLTREPELRRSQSGTSVLKLGLAVNNRRQNKQTGEWEDAPCFVDCVVFGKRAEVAADRLGKGAKVGVDGKLSYSSWEKDGQKRSKLEVLVDDLDFMAGQKPKSEHVQAGVYDDDIPF